MSQDTPDNPEWEISTHAEFDSALETILLAALDNGLDPLGSWVYRNGQTHPDIEVMVTELAKAGDGTAILDPK